MKILPNHYKPQIQSRHIKKYLTVFYSLLRRGKKSYNPIRLHIESTTACNLKCKMCPHGYFKIPPKMLKFEKLKRLIREINPLFVDFSGLGEPLLNKDIYRMIALCKNLGIYTKINTNGTLLNEQTSKKLSDSGLSALLLSLDGSTKEVYEKIRVGANFESVITNFQKCVDSHLFNNIAIHVTLSRYNYHQLIDIIEFCIKKFGIIPSVGNCNTFYTESDDIYFDGSVLDNISLDDIDLQLDLDDVNKKYLEAIKHFAGTENKNLISSLEFNYKQINNEIDVASFNCYMPYYNVFINHNGGVYPCCYLQYKRPFANINEIPFNSVWNSSELITFRNSLKKRRTDLDVCNECYFNDPIHKIVRPFA